MDGVELRGEGGHAGGTVSGSSRLDLVRAAGGLRKVRLVIAGCFLAALWLPLIQMGLHVFPEVDTAEKRKEVAAPSLTDLGLQRFSRVYEPHFRDHFGLRDRLLRWENLLLWRVLHASPVSKLIFGREGWIFYDSDRVPDGITIRDYQGLAPYTPAELQRIRANLSAWTSAGQDLGAESWIVIAPNKETIYAEYLPPTIRRIGRQTRLDQVLEELRGDSTMQIIDLRSVLQEARRVCPYPLYMRGGPHWNQFGAYYAYREIMEQIGRREPGLRPYDLDAFHIEVDARSAEDHWLGLKDDLAFRFTLDDSSASPADRRPLGKTIVWHDSFWGALEPFFRIHEPELVARSGKVGPDEKLALIAQERPRIVIYEVVERYADAFWNR